MDFILTSDIDRIHESNRKQLIANNRADFFNSLEWYSLFSKHCLPDGYSPLFLSGIGRGPDESGFTLFLCTPAGQPGARLTSPLFRGQSLSSLTNYQTGRFAPAITASAAEDRQAVIRLMATGIREKLGDFAMFDFNHCDPDTDAARTITEAFRTAGFTAEPYFYNITLMEPTRGCDYETFLSRRSRKFRQNLRRWERQLAKLGTLDYALCSGTDDLERHIGHYESVLALSWKEPEPFPAFSSGIIAAAARSGVLRLGFLFLDGKPIGTQFWISSGGRATIYKSHFDGSYGAKFGIGNLLTMKMMQDVIAMDAIHTVDFGTGGEVYKKEIMSGVQELSGVAAFNTRLLKGRILLAQYRAGTLAACAKQRIKNALQGLRLPGARSVPAK